MSFKSIISTAVNEKDVENIYRSELIKAKDASITSPFKIDGLLESGYIRCLLEFKYKENFKDKLTQCNVLIQCVYYLKKFELNGHKLPKTILVGDINECFVIHINSIIKYLSYDINWSIAPSEAHRKNPDMLQDMMNDEKIIPFVFDIDDEFNIYNIINKITEYTENIRNKVRITKYNIVKIYNIFNNNILGKTQLTINERVNLFIQIIINPDDNYLHPKRKNFLVSSSYGVLPIRRNSFLAFFEHFEGSIYSPKEKEGLTALSDRLIEDITRRSKGEFYTPTPHVALAHSYLSETFGEDWKERFVVWDCCWGTGNLTRDYKFKELYCSTLEQSDIDTANQMGYNPEAIKFQFDFLNDSNNKLPEELRKAIKSDKEILFLINPPYMRSGNNKTSKTKSGATESLIVEKMKKEEFGACTANLYAQFLYRIYKYQEIKNNIRIGLFSPTLYLTGSSFKKFREKFFNKFGYERGFMFPASHFSDVANNWGISFSIWNNILNDYKNNFTHDIFIDEEEGANKIKNLYNIDFEISLKDISTKKTKKKITNKTLGIKSFNNPVLKESYIPEDFLGNLSYQSNNIEGNSQFVAFFSAVSGLNGKGKIEVSKDNLFNACVFFTARKSIQSNWLNWQDEYLAPNEEHPDYQQFSYDAIVYSLFNNKSQQSSLRQIEYKDKLWDIKNEFFWMSKEDMLNLAEENNFDELYRDVKADENRFVYKKLFDENIYSELSPDAKQVLNTATELTKKSIAMRKILADSKPEYHLNAWDAGYAQLKLVWKEYFNEEFKTFRNQYKSFERRLIPLVYELGFLKK